MVLFEVFVTRMESNEHCYLINKSLKVNAILFKWVSGVITCILDLPDALLVEG